MLVSCSSSTRADVRHGRMQQRKRQRSMCSGQEKKAEQVDGKGGEAEMLRLESTPSRMQKCLAQTAAATRAKYAEDHRGAFCVAIRTRPQSRQKEKARARKRRRSQPTEQMEAAPRAIGRERWNGCSHDQSQQQTLVRWLMCPRIRRT